VPHFFGLSSDHRVHVLEEIYQLIRHLGVGYEECRRMPIRYRRWFIDRIVEDFNKKKKQREKDVITQDTGPTVNLMGTDKRSFS